MKLGVEGKKELTTVWKMQVGREREKESSSARS